MLLSMRAEQIKEVTLTGEPISIEEFVAVARYDAKVVFSPKYEECVRSGQQRLQRVLDSGKAVYGVNTGFGDNVRYRISDDKLSLLQQNILRSHACSVGHPMSRDEVRGNLIGSLVKAGYSCSGLRLEIPSLIRDFLNLGLTPYVPVEGSVGCIPYVTYLALTIMGEGRILIDGKPVPTAEVLKQYNLSPIQLHAKEGFAIMGTMGTGMAPAILGIYDSINLMQHSLITAALTSEALQCTDKHFDPRLLDVKKHCESSEVGSWIRSALSNSKIMESARETRVQDAVCIRLIPHLMGAVIHQITDTYESVCRELASVVDNPVFLPDGTALMGSNWDTSYIAIGCDSLAIGLATLGKELTTYTDRLVDTKLSGLPPFLTKEPGLNNGFMIVQYVTTGLNADIAYLSNPMSVVNTSVSAGQEAPNSRSDSAARKLVRVTEKLRSLVALTMMTAVQALDFIDLPPSPVNEAARQEIRRTVSFMAQDDRMYERIEAMEQIIDSGVLLDIYKSHIGSFPL